MEPFMELSVRERPPTKPLRLAVEFVHGCNTVELPKHFIEFEGPRCGGAAVV